MMELAQKSYIKTSLRAKQMESIMNRFKQLFMIAGLLLLSFSLWAHDPKGESFKLSGKVTSIELSSTGGVINVSSEAGRYGKVFLTYNVTINPNLPDQGYFSGRGVGITDEGVRNNGSRQGVFKREGHLMKFYSLDDASDGYLNYCESVIDLKNETIEMTFYPY
jgi:hypothetical protein|tara:strand:- start:510 stop:1001 length:492 start_codon:yes stop_codon:yes gene_type:complete